MWKIYLNLSIHEEKKYEKIKKKHQICNDEFISYLKLMMSILAILKTMMEVTKKQMTAMVITNMQTTWKLPSGSQQWLPLHSLEELVNKKFSV